MPVARAGQKIIMLHELDYLKGVLKKGGQRPARVQEREGKGPPSKRFGGRCMVPGSLGAPHHIAIKVTKSAIRREVLFYKPKIYSMAA